MLKFFRKADPDDAPIYGTELGDLGVIVVAAGITIAGLLYLFTPSPFAILERAQAQQETAAALAAKQARQKEIDKAVATGEVGVDILPARTH
jgi:hypothetical protein